MIKERKFLAPPINMETQPISDVPHINGEDSGKENFGEKLDIYEASAEKEETLEKMEVTPERSTCRKEKENLNNSRNIENTCKELSESKLRKPEKLSKKKTKNQIKDERLKIHSETHRLMRERQIAIPYHVPKERSLREFLSRKKNRAYIPLNTPSSKMMEIWKDIEESTRSAFDFFRSDSDSDSEVSASKVSGSQELNKEGESLPGDKSASRSSMNGNEISDNYNEIKDDKQGFTHENKEDVTNENPNELSNVDKLLSLSEQNSLKVSSDIIQSETFKDGDDSHADVNNDIFNSKTMCSVEERHEFHNVAESNVTTDISNNIEVSKKLDESSEDIRYNQERTKDWVKNIPVCEKLLRQNKKGSLLQKLNPKLLKITPKLSGEPDSFIDLENVGSTIEAGAKNLKKRFIENCIAPRKKMNNEVQLTITTSETNDKGQICNITSEKLFYNSTIDFHDPSLDRPGAKLQRLREELKKKIEEKWEEEYKKKALEEVTIENEKDKETCDDDILDDEEEFLEDSDDETTSSISEEDGSKNEDSVLDEDIVREKRRKKNQFIDSEAEESECEDEESGNEGGDECDDEEDESKTALDDNISTEIQHSNMPSDKVLADKYSCNDYGDSQSSLITPYQPGGGMLHGSSEISQGEGDCSLQKNLLSSALGLSLEFSPTPKNNSNPPSEETWSLGLDLLEETNKKGISVPNFSEAGNFDLSDAYELCSGKFPDEDGEIQCTKVSDDSRDFLSVRSIGSGSNSMTLFNNKIPNAKDVEDHRNNGSTSVEERKRCRLKIVSDDSGDEIDCQLNDLKDVEHITGTRILSEESDNDSQEGFIAKSRRRKNLYISDDEENSRESRHGPGVHGVEHEEEVPDEDNEGDSSQNEAEEPYREVEYDSEEQEINPKEFFEKEAELSGSEWSCDEDERELDNFEQEDGDADKLNEKEVRSQLQKIHMRTLLDDDERDVRIIQELLFEDGDLFDDGPKKEKNFRWKDLGTFFEEDNITEENHAEPQEEVDDEESAKTRHEKELFLLQLKSKRDEMGLDDEDGKSMLKLGKIVLENSKKVPVTKEKTPKNGTENLDGISCKTALGLTNCRGSFLSRNEEFLSKLAKFTSNATDNILGPKHSKNFVFASKSPEKQNPSKENSHQKRRGLSPNKDVNKSKRAKFEEEITSVRASILDRLA